MRTAMKVWLIIAAVLFGIGVILMAGALLSYSINPVSFKTADYETTTFDFQEDAIRNISIDTKTADLYIVPSEDDLCHVVAFDRTNMKYSAWVEGDTLHILGEMGQNWKDFLPFNFESSRVTISLPKSEYKKLTITETTGAIQLSESFTFETVDVSFTTGEVMLLANTTDFASIRATTGSVHVQDVSVGNLEVSVRTGKVLVSNVTCSGKIGIKVSTGDAQIHDTTCRSLLSDGSTGDISLANVLIQDELTLTRSTGDIRLKDSDAATISIETSTGDVIGSLLSGKSFLANTDTGSVRVPASTSGGSCEISTNTGDIDITVVR